MIKWLSAAVVLMTLVATVSFGVSAQQNQMSFFVSSAGSGNGANLGGLAGATRSARTSRRRPAAAARPGMRI
jgi:hypothetical protein